MSKRKDNYNDLVTRPGRMIPTMCQWLCDPNINLDLFFAFYQTFNQIVTSTLLLPPSSFLYQLGYNLLYISISFF